MSELTRFPHPSKRFTRAMTLRLTEGDMGLVEKLAEARGCDICDVMRIAIREHLASNGLLPEEEKEALGIH